MKTERRVPQALAWGAFIVAFSPVLADLAGYFAQGGHQGAVCLAAPLILLCWWRGPTRAREPSIAGLVLLGLGLATELTGIAADAWSVARLGLPIGFLGLARWQGVPPFSVALLAFFAMPAPLSVILVTTPWLESTWAGFGAGLVSALGPAINASGPLFRSAGGFLELTGTDAGLPTALVLAELAGYAGLRTGRSWLRLALQTTLGAAAALIVQPLAVVVAVALLVTVGAEWARGWLDWGLWIILAAVGIAFVEIRAGRGQALPATDRRA